MVNVLQSRRFVTVLVDVVISTLLYLVGKFLSPDTQEFIKFLIVTWQPVIALLIIAFTHEDVQQAKLDAASEQAKLDARLDKFAS